MKTFLTIQSLRDELNLVKGQGKTVGLVPTMGALHEGHAALVRQSVEQCAYTIVSIFVNPTQFNNPDDLEKYPKTLESDLELLEGLGVDMVFAPSAEEMYPTKPELTIGFGAIEAALEGEHRPGHFRGVGLVVSKLFNIVGPSHAYFGQKDLQQYYVIKKLIDELCLPVNLIRVPIVRESNGLAMSSRNVRLSHEERDKAGLIYQSLNTAKQNLLDGVALTEVKQHVHAAFADTEGMVLEYFEAVETQNFTAVGDTQHDEVALCIAVNVGAVRLIDNLLLFS